MTEIYHLSGMKSFREDLIDRMKTGRGRFVLASLLVDCKCLRKINKYSFFLSNACFASGAELLPGEPERPGREQGLCARQDRGLSQRSRGHRSEGIPRGRQQTHVAGRPRGHAGQRIFNSIQQTFIGFYVYEQHTGVASSVLLSPIVGFFKATLLPQGASYICRSPCPTPPPY